MIGLAMIALGLATFVGLASHAPTALIPAAFGILYVVLAAVARQPHRRRLAMHLAAALSLIGLLATVSAIVPMVRLIAGDAIERPAAVLARTGMAVLSATHLGLALHSFLKARSSRG